jgi:hypothetical protein
MIQMIKSPVDQKAGFKSILNMLGILGLIVAVYLYFSEYNVDVRRSPKLMGRVERAYLRNYTTGSSRNSKTIQVFAFKLDRSPEILGVYRPMYDYASLIDSVRVGDEVTVYYKPAPHRSVDLDVFQIEKGNALILDYAIYRHRYIVQSYMLGAIAVFLLLVAQIAAAVARSRQAE